jgi:hypothetical protein
LFFVWDNLERLFIYRSWDVYSFSTGKACEGEEAVEAFFVLFFGMCGREERDVWRAESPRGAECKYSGDCGDLV